MFGRFAGSSREHIPGEYEGNVNDNRPWVFVSHSSADLEKVRQVRNFMEDRGAAPILFHLRALTDPEKFWPLIEQEISARNFFLLCDSEAARASLWVQREWEAVRKIANQRAIRVGRIDLDKDHLDFDRLGRFLLNLHVYVVGSRGGRDFEILESFGYHPLGAVTFSREGLMRLGDGSQMSGDMISHFDYAASRGWLLIILSDATVESENFWREIPKPSAKERIMFVLPKGMKLPQIAPEIPSELLVIQKGSFESALAEAAQRMLTGGPD